AGIIGAANGIGDNQVASCVDGNGVLPAVCVVEVESGIHGDVAGRHNTVTGDRDSPISVVLFRIGRIVGVRRVPQSEGTVYLEGSAVGNQQPSLAIIQVGVATSQNGPIRLRMLLKTEDC